jgi:hypothetical protein
MATYRLFPSTSGPANAISYSGNFISGMCFTVSQGGCWFQGYWWWVAPGSGGSPVPGSTGPFKCALWSLKNGSTGTVVSGSVVTSGTLTAGQWNFIPIATPVQLSNGYDPAASTHGSAYVAAIGVNSNFIDTNSQFNSGDVYAAGITNGPLVAYSGTTGSKPAPYSLHQGVFSVGGSDPSTILPTTGDSGGDGGSNFWVDVQVSTTAPAGYAGSYRLWPGKADANAATTNDSELNYTIATEVTLSTQCTLNNIWYYSPSGSTQLATRCDVWNISTGLSAASITSPSWSGTAGTGWLSAAFTGGTTLPAGDYRVSVYCANGTSGFWGAKDASTSYWATGAGSAGITWGPLSAPSLAAASDCWEYNASDSGATPPYSNGTQEPGQSPFGQLPAGLITFPQLYADGLAQNYWVDLEVTPPQETTSPVTGASAAAAVVTAAKTGRSLLAGHASAAGTSTAVRTAAGHVTGPAAADAAVTAHRAAPGLLAGPASAGASAVAAKTAAGHLAGPAAAAAAGRGTKTTAGQITAAAAAAASAAAARIVTAFVRGTSAVTGLGRGTRTAPGVITGPLAAPGTSSGSTPSAATMAGTAAAAGAFAGSAAAPASFATGPPRLAWSGKAPLLGP